MFHVKTQIFKKSQIFETKMKITTFMTNFITPISYLILLGFIPGALSFRLLTLDQLGEKNMSIFIANSNSMLKLQKVTPENISQFYVVVHANKIFFYSKGTYHGFSYDVDNVKLKLSPVTIGKLQMFTQEDDHSDRRVKIMKWEDMISRPNRTTEKKVQIKETDKSDNENGRNYYSKPQYEEFSDQKMDKTSNSFDQQAP